MNVFFPKNAAQTGPIYISPDVAPSGQDKNFSLLLWQENLTYDYSKRREPEVRSLATSAVRNCPLAGKRSILLYIMPKKKKKRLYSAMDIMLKKKSSQEFRANLAAAPIEYGMKQCNEATKRLFQKIIIYEYDNLLNFTRSNSLTPKNLGEKNIQ